MASIFRTGKRQVIFFAVAALNRYAQIWPILQSTRRRLVRPRSFVLPALAAFALASATCWHLTGSAQEPPKVPNGVHLPIKFQFQGAGSCAAAACHNADAHDGFVGREYSLALERDPANPHRRVLDRHAQAYEVLLEKRSEQIERNLHPDKHVRPETDALCLRCHVHPSYDTRMVRVVDGVSQFRKEDGVSCEACHGPAQHWLATHFRSERSPAQREAEGQYDTRSLPGRIQLCVDCHVGAPGMDVNHDLIAAGHPRLTFEFSGFHFLWHKHWDHAKDASQPSFEARAWLLGQVIAAQASLRLLADRADEKNGRVWPEFAEHDCAACHHDLNGKSDRQAPGFEKRKPGVMPQNRWNVAMLTRALEGLGAPADNQLATALDDIRKGLESLPLQRKQVAKQARQALALLEDRLALAERRAAGPNAADGLLAKLVAAASPGNGSDDDVVQLFLAKAAYRRACKDVPPPSLRATMRMLLQLPGDDRTATMNQGDFRKTVHGLRGKGSR
jgi:hypothetical protein